MRVFIVEENLKGNKVKGLVVELEKGFNSNCYTVKDESKLERVADKYTTKLNYFITTKDNLEYKETYLTLIKEVIDELDHYFQRVVLGEYVTDRQIERYRVKYERALANDKAFFKDEATNTGLTVTKLINAVKAKGDQWVQERDNNIAKLEAIRVALKAKVLKSKGVDVVKPYINRLSQINETNIGDFFNDEAEAWKPKTQEGLKDEYRQKLKEEYPDLSDEDINRILEEG